MLKFMISVLTMLFLFGLVANAHATVVKAAGATIVQAVIDKLAKPFMEKNPGITIKTAGGGSSVAIVSAAEGAVDIGMPARPLTAEEAKLYPDLKFFVFAKDGAAIVVHPTNMVKGLTGAQIREIFAGKVTDWSQVGGKAGPINLCIREKGSGTRVAFEEALMGKEKLGKAKVGGSTGAIKKMVADDPQAIGYIVIGAVDASVKALELDGKVPTIDNVKAGIYTLTTPFYMITRGEPKGATKTFFDFALGKEGQALVEKEKLVPVGPTK